MLAAIAALATLVLNLTICSDRQEPYKNMILSVEGLKIEIDFRATKTKKYLEDLDLAMANGNTSKLEELTLNLLAQATDQAKNNFRVNHLSEYAGDDMSSLLSRLELLSKPDSNMQKILDDATTSTLELQSLQKILYGHILLTSEPQETRSMSAVKRSNNTRTTMIEIVEGTTRQLMDLSAVTGKSYLTDVSTLVTKVDTWCSNQAAASSPTGMSSLCLPTE